MNLLELTPKKDVLFIIGDWNEKVGSQETPEITGKFGLGMRNEAGQRLIEFCQDDALVIANILFQQTQEKTLESPLDNKEIKPVECFYEDLQDLLELTTKKDVIFIIGDCNAKVGSQEIPGVTGKFGL